MGGREAERARYKCRKGSMTIGTYVKNNRYLYANTQYLITETSSAGCSMGITTRCTLKAR